MSAALNAFLLVLSASFVTYVALILIPFLRHRAGPEGDPKRFDWHIFIPCRDEEAVIGDAIRVARERFPAAHVWVIDDASEDRTGEIVMQHAADDPLVHCVRRTMPEARTGKGAALNAAYEAMNRWAWPTLVREQTIVVVVDADGELSPNAFAVAASAANFADPAVGAAQLTVWMKNRNDAVAAHAGRRMRRWLGSILVRLQDLEFRTVIAGMQSLRVRTGTVGLGGNGQFTRLSVLDTIAREHGSPWHGSLLEDYELGVHVVLAGFEVRHIHDTHVSQEGLPSLRRLLTQRTRWAQGNMQCVKYVPTIVRSQQVDASGVLETCYYLLLPFIQLFGMLVLIAAMSIDIAQAAADPVSLQTRLDQLPSQVLLVILFSGLPFVVWGPIYRQRCEPQLSVVHALLLGIALWIYNYYLWLVLPRAFFRLVARRSGWLKTRRNTEPAFAGTPIATER